MTIAALGLAAIACQPKPASLAADKPTAPGQRLWYLGLPVVSGAAQTTDAQVAIPLLRALDKDGRVQVIGALSSSEWCLLGGAVDADCKRQGEQRHHEAYRCRDPNGLLCFLGPGLP